MVQVSHQTPWTPPDTFASRLRQLRNALNMTVEEIASQCGLAPATWSTWENGANPRNLGQVVVKIVEATNVNRDWLMWGAVNPALNPATLTAVAMGEHQMILNLDGKPTNLRSV